VKLCSIHILTNIPLFNNQDIITVRLCFRCQIVELLEDIAALPDLLLLLSAQQVSYHSVPVL